MSTRVQSEDIVADFRALKASRGMIVQVDASTPMPLSRRRLTSPTAIRSYAAKGHKIGWTAASCPNWVKRKSAFSAQSRLGNGRGSARSPTSELGASEEDPNVDRGAQAKIAELQAVNASVAEKLDGAILRVKKILDY